MRETDQSSAKKTILDASIRTIAHYKLSGTRMRHIAEEANMSQALVHYYFGSKQLLIHELLDYMLASFVGGRATQLDSPDLSSLEKLKLFLDEKKSALRERSQIMLVYYDLWVAGTREPDVRAKMAQQYEVWRQDIERVVQEGVSRGVFDSLHADQVPALLVSVMEGAALQYLIDREGFDLDMCFADAYEMILHLLGVSPESHALAMEGRPGTSGRHRCSTS